MNPNEAIQSLSRITQASARLMADMHLSGQPRDMQGEVDHMQANLDHVRAQVDAWRGKPVTR